MDINLITLITLSAMFLTMLTGLIAIIKFLFSLKDEISKLKIEVANLNSKFGIVEDRQTATNQRIDKLEAELKEQRVENNNVISKVFDRLELSKAIAIH